MDAAHPDRWTSPGRHSLLKVVVLVLALAASPALAQEMGPFAQTCTYRDARAPVEDEAFEVHCTMRYVSTPVGIRSSFRFGGRTVVVDSISGGANGLWDRVTIDGRPGVSLELWRGSYVAVTNDLRVSFEWRDRNGPKYPVN